MNQRRSVIGFLVLFLCSVSVTGHAQSYGSALGIRFGNSSDFRTVGLTGQYRIAKHVTLEAIAQTNFSDDHTGHFLIEQHRAFLTRRFNIYVGTGVSFGSERSKSIDPNTNIEVVTVNNQTIGADVVFGVETTLFGTNVSIDVKPNFNIVGRENWIENQVGISVRQVLVKSGEQKRKKKQRERAKKKKQREKERKDREPLLGKWWAKVTGKD